jgi:hypothetical protein
VKMSVTSVDGRRPGVNVSEYPGRPVLKPPVWTWEVPVYFFTGGLSGASAALALAAEMAGQRRLARRARLAALAAVAVSPPLLIVDLGRPERFLNMLRVFRPTSPMSMGAWILTAVGSSVGVATASEFTGIGRRAGRVAGAVAGTLGLALATYTGVLLGQTSIPAWERARTRLPLLFAASSAAAAGGLASVLGPAEEAGPARLLAVGGAAASVLVRRVMEHDLGEDGAVYREGEAGRFGLASDALTVVGAALVGAAGRRRWLSVPGGLALMAGSLAKRISIWRAGPASARRT